LSSTCASRTNTRSPTSAQSSSSSAILPARAGELDKNAEIVIHCKSGGRSQKASEFLAQNGFKNVSNLAGGITAWSNDIDPAIPKY
jgi:adenylyltransferase/sulfurtransferase